MEDMSFSGWPFSVRMLLSPSPFTPYHGAEMAPPLHFDVVTVPPSAETVDTCISAISDEACGRRKIACATREKN